MAPQLLEFPVEIIEKIVKNLIPPLSASTMMGTSLYHDLQHRPIPPADLCRLMLVCKAFPSLVRPLAWRRATIRIPDKKSDDDGLDSDSDDDSDDGDQPPDQSWSLKRHIDGGAAAHIRVLNITITERGVDSLSQSLRLLCPVVRLMDNIRVLKFIFGNPAFELDALNEIYTPLISNPRLHTLITNYYAPSSILPAPSFRSLKNLHVGGNASWSFPALLQGGTPDLESFVLENYYKDTSTLSLPWATLREVALMGVDSWLPILDNFLSWKKTSPTTPKLTELFVDNGTVSRKDLKKFVLGFQSQNITTFRVSRVDTIDGALLDVIADSFPKLQNLGMMDKAYNDFGAWDVDLPTVSQFLRKLPKLKSLYWNYVDGWTPPWSENYTPPTENEFRKILRVIGKSSHSLENVTFYRMVESFSYAFTRNDTGGYGGYVKETNHRDATPWPTSSWNTSHYEEI